MIIVTSLVQYLIAYSKLIWPYLDTMMPCKAKRQPLLTLQVSSDCLLALPIGIAHDPYMEAV